MGARSRLLKELKLQKKLKLLKKLEISIPWPLPVP